VAAHGAAGKPRPRPEGTGTRAPAARSPAATGTLPRRALAPRAATCCGMRPMPGRPCRPLPSVRNRQVPTA